MEPTLSEITLKQLAKQLRVWQIIALWWAIRNDLQPVKWRHLSFPEATVHAMLREQMPRTFGNRTA